MSISGTIMEWTSEFNRRVMVDGTAVPFDPGFDRDGDPDGFGDPDVYADFFNSNDPFIETGGVDGVHPGALGHYLLAQRIDEMLAMAATVGVPNVGIGVGNGQHD